MINYFSPSSVVNTQRIENALIAISILVAVVVAGLPWWILFAAFLLFDLSAIGYLHNSRTGAFFYNLVHNYSGPALVALLYVILYWRGGATIWLLMVAACWAFHVAVDRAVGYGLKLETFQHTHLGVTGKVNKS